MASQHILATSPSKDAILDSLVENIRAYNARLPCLYVGMRECNLDAEMPLLLNPPAAPLACREPPAEFEAVNAHFSAQVHAFFSALHDLEDMSDKKSSDELDLIRQDEAFGPPSVSSANPSTSTQTACTAPSTPVASPSKPRTAYLSSTASPNCASSPPRITPLSRE